MNAGFLVVLGVLSLAAPDETDSSLSQDTVFSKVEITFEWVCRVAGRVRGRILSSLMKKGMTMEEVDRVLIGDPHRREKGGLIGSHIFWDWCYYTHGLTISFTNEKDSVLRLDRVTPWPLFD